MKNYYVKNNETQKIELHFEKAVYQALDDEIKKSIKSNFLWSNSRGCWTSRAKFPNLYYAERAAKAAGLENAGAVGERMTFAEHMEAKAERAEQRAERYDERSEAANRRAEELQKPINDRRGDISFFTQPNINTSDGRAFTNYRNKLFAAWERGFEEFKKSEYYADRAETARRTAENAKTPPTKAFCQRRIDEAEKDIRQTSKNIEHYTKQLEKIDAGEEVRNYYSGEIITRESVINNLERQEEIKLQAIEKSIYYREAMEKISGGVVFSRENIHIGDIVELEESWNCRAWQVYSCGPKNIQCKEVGRQGFLRTESYAGIKRVIKAAEQPAEGEQVEPKHPFRVGDTFPVEVWSYATHKYEAATLVITNITAERVSYKINGGRAHSVKVRPTYNGNGYHFDAGARHFIEKAI